MISSKYLKIVIKDLERYENGNYTISDEKHISGLPYACYICFASLNSYILIENRRYHKNCLELLMEKQNFINFKKETNKKIKRVNYKLISLNN